MTSLGILSLICFSGCYYKYLDRKYAHKPWVIKWKGTVYHFYTAVGEYGRAIALATSKDFGESELPGNKIKSSESVGFDSIIREKVEY